MKVGDKVKVAGSELEGVIWELFPADGVWGATAIVCFPDGEKVEYELTELEAEEKETKKFLVPVSWTISAMVEIEAEDAVEANDFAFGMDLDTIEGADYVPNSFDVDFGMIEEVQ